MNFSKLDAFMNDMPLRGFPMSELAIAKDGAVVYRRSVGFADAAKTRQSSKNDIYWIFSATKVITCIAAMRLVSEGKLSLDDPVSKYIPEFSSVTVTQKDGDPTPAKNTMTVEHLFTMTAGLSYDIRCAEITETAQSDPSTLGIVRAMARIPLRFEPGTHYLYSLCHDVLAAIVELVSGMRFSEYLEQSIFKPLGIRDMGFRPSPEQEARFTDMFMYQNGTASAVPTPRKNAFILSPEYDSGGAGLFATVDEYIKIISVIANGGVTEDGYVLLPPKYIAMMGENRLCDDALNNFVGSRFHGYGWGLCGRAHINPVMSLSRAPVGEFGWDGAAAAFVMIDPSNKLALYFGTSIFSCQYAYHVVHPTLRNLTYECLGED